MRIYDSGTQFFFSFIILLNSLCSYFFFFFSAAMDQIVRTRQPKCSIHGANRFCFFLFFSTYPYRLAVGLVHPPRLPPPLKKKKKNGHTKKKYSSHFVFHSTYPGRSR